MSWRENNHPFGERVKYVVLLALNMIIQGTSGADTDPDVKRLGAIDRSSFSTLRRVGSIKC